MIENIFCTSSERVFLITMGISTEFCLTTHKIDFFSHVRLHDISIIKLTDLTPNCVNNPFNYGKIHGNYSTRSCPNIKTDRKQNKFDLGGERKQEKNNSLSDRTQIPFIYPKKFVFLFS